MSRKKGKKEHHGDHLRESGLFGRYVVNSLLIFSFALIFTSFAILVLVIFEEKAPKKEAVVVAPPKSPSEKLIEKMGDIVAAQEQKEAIPMESDDYAHALTLVAPTPKVSEPVTEPVVEVKKPPVKAVKKHKPRLAIIIDDVSNIKEIRNLKATGIPLSISIFPPTSNFPSTPKIARGLDFYMIHLPLEAMNFNRPQEKTLTTLSTPLEIEGRIKEIRRLFPAAKLINNHTGSKFTSDMDAMMRLIPTLKKYGFTFVDSRTTGGSKAVEVGERAGMPILSRDIFLDNEPDVDYIHDQLKKAVLLAKKKGQAIAIGHPREKTIEALMSADRILDDIDVVYVRELL